MRRFIDTNQCVGYLFRENIHNPIVDLSLTAVLELSEL